MYKDIETEVSYQYLKTVISKLKEPICILGGWAVFFTVSRGFRKEMKRVYLGSRDIDLGFESAESFKESATILEKELNFRPVSFRYAKAIHAETGKDLTEKEAKSLPEHMIFRMCVDPLFPAVPAELRKALGFTPIDEPLLNEVFEKKRCTEVKEFGRKLLLPNPDILLATKLNAVVARDKDHKRIKDVCDIVALCLFSDMPIQDIISKAKQLASKLHVFRKLNLDNDIARCSEALGLERSTVSEVIAKLKE